MVSGRPAKAATLAARRIADRRVIWLLMSFPIGLFLSGCRLSSAYCTADFDRLKPHDDVEVYDGRAAPQRRARSRAELSEGGWVQEVHHRCRRGEVVPVEEHLLR